MDMHLFLEDLRPAPLACDRRLLCTGTLPGRRDVIVGVGGKVSDCDGREMGVVFVGSAGEVHKHALEVMGQVEWVILQADQLVPSDALLAASTRHGTRLAVVLSDEQHLLDFEPALPRTGALIVTDEEMLSKAIVHRMALNKSESLMLNTVCGGIFLPAAEELKLVTVESVEVIHGCLEQIYLDMINMLQSGEGALVGSTAKALCFIHADAGGRAFRINAGPVHAYVALPDGRTKYLSDVEAGDQILMMNNTECEAPPLKRSVSPSSDVEHSPLFGPSTSPEARDHAHHSELWGLPVKELKQRLKAVGSDVRGVDRCQVARIRLCLDGEHSQLFLEWTDAVHLHGRQAGGGPSEPLPLTQLRGGDEILCHWASSSPARVNHVHSMPSENFQWEKDSLTLSTSASQSPRLQRSEWQRQNEAAAAAARLSLIKVYSKVMEEIEPKKALVLESPPVQDEELARIVANAAVAKSTVGAVCRLLALKPPSPQEAPSSPTRTQWIQVKPALSESDVSDLRSPRPKQFQKCSSADPEERKQDTEMTGPGQSLQSQTTVSGMDESPEAKRDERLDAKLNVSPVIGRHLDEKSPKHTEGHEDQEDVRLAERDGELAKLAKLEDLDPKLQEALIQLEALQAAGQKRCIFAAWRGLWAATVSGQGSAAPWSGGTGVDMEGSEEEACTLKTLEDFLQEADELEEKVRQSSKASLETFVDDATEEPTEGHRLGGAGAGAGEWKDSEDGCTEEAEIQAARPPALEQAALCDEGAEVTAAEGTLKMVPRLHGSLHGLPLQSLDETPGPLEVVAGLGRCLVASRDFQAGHVLLSEPPLLAASAVPAPAPDDVTGVLAAGPWTCAVLSPSAARRLAGLVLSYARSDRKVREAVLQLDDAMSERLAGVIRRFALQLRTAGFAGEVPKPELQCILRIFWVNGFPFGEDGSAALPRRASSAPPERRNRGRRRKIVPLVISTGLATAPTSQIPSPNSVFPTPLLPRPTQAARRSKSSAR
eukprot:g10074.t2